MNSFLHFWPSFELTREQLQEAHRSTLSVWLDREPPSRQITAVVRKNTRAAIDPDQSATFKLPGGE